MKKAEIIEAILADMYKHDDKQSVNTRFKGWLKKQNIETLSRVLENRQSINKEETK